MVKIFGLFRISGPQKVWILIMGNAFPPKVSFVQVFDLKVRPPFQREDGPSVFIPLPLPLPLS